MMKHSDFTHDELRLCRREIINGIIFLLRYESLAYLKEYVRLNESLHYGFELKAY